MALSHHATGLNRQSPFGFTCNRCLACCRYKKIQLNPYEIARLADNRGLSTTEFIARHTIGGTVLRFDGEGACVFLGPEGCEVHRDRPLVCRLYPLGRYVDFLGVETFAQIELQEGCQGRLHQDGVIAQYLEEQGALPFMRAADRYLDLLWHLVEQLKQQDMEPDQSAALIETAHTVAEGSFFGPEQAWIDMDRVLPEYCRSAAIPVPDDIDQKMALHIKAVRQWAA